MNTTVKFVALFSCAAVNHIYNMEVLNAEQDYIDPLQESIFPEFNDYSPAACVKRFNYALETKSDENLLLAKQWYETAVCSAVQHAPHVEDLNNF